MAEPPHKLEVALQHGDAFLGHYAVGAVDSLNEGVLLQPVQLQELHKSWALHEGGCQLLDRLHPL